MSLFEAQFTKMFSNTDTDLKESVAYKNKRVFETLNYYLIETFS